VISRFAGGWTLAVGLALAVWTVRAASGLPLPLVCALIGTAILEIALGYGLLRRARAAWSFAVSLTSVLAVALLIALPAIFKSGGSTLLGTAAAMLIATQLVLLVTSRRDL
jgi:hypothetical protein